MEVIEVVSIRWDILNRCLVRVCLLKMYYHLQPNPAVFSFLKQALLYAVFCLFYGKLPHICFVVFLISIVVEYA